MEDAELKQSLMEIGLLDKEVDLYLSLLKLGPSSILRMSKGAKMHRPMVYKLVENLVDKGIFKTTIVGKRKEYLAVQPKQLLNFIRNKESLLKNILPDLEKIGVTGSKETKIIYFEGREQLRELFRSGLQTKSKEMYSFFPSKYMIELFGKREMEEIIAERARKKIRVKTLRSLQTEEEFSGSKLTTEVLREYRYIPDSRIFEMGIVIFDNKVNLFSPIKENFGLQIESEAFSKLMKYFFESLWSISKKARITNG